ncbi:MAG: DUF4190 domain-containing protein [Coriobacteriia bacterium]|nr:DUF4190 domain-containing protein [Coriobacteriia bacterium]MCL2749839.1 DUF4190 domain-containing protein [Coriobacteriia bacterium]
MSEQQAGWYPDPAGDATKLRYWDGTNWTNDFNSVQAPPTTVQEVQPVQPVQATVQPVQPPQPVQATVQPVQPPAVGSGSGYNYSQMPASPGYVQPPASATNGLAVASLICGIAGFCSGGLLSIVAIILGVLARKKPEQQGLALAGIILGIAALVLYILTYIGIGLLGWAAYSW